MTIGQAIYLKTSLEYLLHLWKERGWDNDEVIINEINTCIGIIKEEFKNLGVKYHDSGC